MIKVTSISSLVIFASVLICFSEEVRKIQDNSFLLEEAYNQEPGVVQHIQSFQRMNDNTWSYSFTQEWPAPDQKHQLSYSVPGLHSVGPDETAMGDVLINYRYQFPLKEKEGVAFAPRLSLVLPTGDYKKGFGNGALGFQTNLPLSVELNQTLVAHWNIGTTIVPGSKGTTGDTADIVGFNYGFSLIWLTAENLNILIESVGSTSETVLAGGETTRSESFFINLGTRFAINFNSGLQIVPGFAFPVGIGPSKGETGILGYLSFEHPFF